MLLFFSTWVFFKTLPHLPPEIEEHYIASRVTGAAMSPAKLADLYEKARGAHLVTVPNEGRQENSAYTVSV